MSDKILSRIKR